MKHDTTQLDDIALNDYDLAFYRHNGHVTNNEVFEPEEIDHLLSEIDQWSQRFAEELSDEDRKWYLEAANGKAAVFRKLDNPHVHLPAAQALAFDQRLVSQVQQFIGEHVSVYFSQIFFKPPKGGGPKPAHQDNFYFGPTDNEGVVTAWLALDDSTLENGCLYFGKGTNQGPVYGHFAPENEPYNLQVPAEILARQPMTPAPVRKGGVSFHHGNTFHYSNQNDSDKWRRACAFHYVRSDVDFAKPALPYDQSLKLSIC